MLLLFSFSRLVIAITIYDCLFVRLFVENQPYAKKRIASKKRGKQELEQGTTEVKSKVFQLLVKVLKTCFYFRIF